MTLICDHSFSNPYFDGQRCNACRDVPVPEDAPVLPECKSCGHSTPHKRVGPVRDSSGFLHADACETCPCINDPAFVPPPRARKGHLAAIVEEAISALRGSSDPVARGKARELSHRRMSLT